MPAMSLRDLNYFHLRRLNQNKPGHEGKDNLILLVENTKFGRNPDMVDVVLTSAVYSNMISRNHAEILGKKNAQGKFDKYTISDSSLNGTYINDQRISNQPHELKEGDVIKFGHMNGAAVKPGQVAPQANAEFAFLVERAQAAHNYLGFDANGRRRTTVSCKGDVDSLTEIVPGTHPEAARITQSVNQTIPGTVTQPTSSVPTISNSLPWSAGQFYGASPAAPGTFQFPQALQFLNFNNATSPAAANQFMSMLGARNQQLDPQWAAAMQCSIQMQPRLATAAQLQQAAAQQAAFGGNPYQTPPSTSASFLPPSALDNRLATSTNATQQANLAFNMQQNSALVNSILQQQQQQQQQQFVQSQQATSQPTSVVQQTGQPHVAVQNSPQIKAEPPTPTLPTAAIKPQVGSPPMECDSSVPSPPKVTATPVAPQPTTAIPRAASPRQTSSDQDQRSEKSWSMVDSPPMPRAPAPSHANRELSRTPSPKSDTPEAEKEAAREKERERREKEEKEREKEEREKERKRKDDEEEKRRKEREREQREARERLKAAEAKAKANKGSRKGSEIARLINDLEGSFMTSARGSDLREQRKSLDGRKEDKDYKEEFSPPPQPKKEKEREKEKEKEKERPKQSGRASKSEKSSTAASTPSEKSVKTEPPTAKQQNKLLKQLSDVSSVSSSSDSEADKKKKKTPTTSNKKTSLASQSKKDAPKRRPATPASDSSDSDSDTNSLSSLDDSHVRAKGSTAKKARRTSTPKALKPSKPKTPIMPPKKRGRKPKSQGSSSSEESPEPEPMYPPPDPNVVFHDPIETCAMEKECNRPQTQNVNWVACDDCEKWYHAICILGKEDITGLDEFTCGCKEKKTKKKKVR